MAVAILSASRSSGSSTGPISSLAWIGIAGGPNGAPTPSIDCRGNAATDVPYTGAFRAAPRLDRVAAPAVTASEPRATEAFIRPSLLLPFRDESRRRRHPVRSAGRLPSAPATTRHGSHK